MKWIKVHIELLAWLVSLVTPFLINPNDTSHFSFCFFKNTGLSWCPGCGLGHSIAYLYRGEWLLAIQTHWLGIVTVVLLIYRIIQLLSKQKHKTTSALLYETKINDDATRHTTK